jgi:hypothetical protein
MSKDFVYFLRTQLSSIPTIYTIIQIEWVPQSLYHSSSVSPPYNLPYLEAYFAFILCYTMYLQAFNQVMMPRVNTFYDKEDDESFSVTSL